MIVNNRKPKKCKNCRKEFTPQRMGQTVCSPPCALAIAKHKRAKPKRLSLPSLIRKADEVTSKHIRLKYADENGNVKCVSCPTVLHWTQAHCAHFIGRAKKATRWLEENLHPACPSCNVFRKEFHMREYTLFMEDFYGREFVNELRALEQQVCSAAQVRKMAEDAIRDYSTDGMELKHD